MSEGQQISHPDWKPGKFRELSTEGLKMNLTIITDRLHKILSSKKKKLDSGEVYRLSLALSGLIRAGLALENRENERQAIIEQVRVEFALIARQEFSKHPELLEQIDAITATVHVT
jgi:hypothetical protein